MIHAGRLRITWATFLTIIRIVLVPFIVRGILHHHWYSTLILFFVAGVTDVADGFLARSRNECTPLGAFLDPIADKILIIGTLWAFSVTPGPYIFVPTAFVMLLCVKEFFLIVGVAIIRLVKGSVTIKPTVWGKLAMAIQTLFVLFLLFCHVFGWQPAANMYVCLLIMVATVTVGAFIHYVILGLCFNKRIGL